MKTKIFIVTMSSYTTSDNNLYNNTWPYNNEKEAQQQYISLRDEQSEECRWGANYDNDDHTDDYEYNVTEHEDGNTYEASSEAYEGYRVQIKLEAVDIEVPYATDRRKYGMTLKEVRDEIAAFTGDKKGEAMRKAKIFAHNISITHVSRIRLSFGHRTDEHGSRTEDPNWLQIEWTDQEGDSDTFSIIE